MNIVSVKTTGAARARRLLAGLVPFDEWLREAPKSEQEQAVYRRLVAELEQVANGQAISEITVRHER